MALPAWRKYEINTYDTGDVTAVFGVCGDVVVPNMVGSEGATVTRMRCDEITLVDGVPNTNRELPLSCKDNFVQFPTLTYVFNGTDWDRIRGDSTDGLWVQNRTVKIGSLTNIANNTTLNSGSTTSSVDVRAYHDLELFYEDSATGAFDGLEVQISDDNSTWYETPLIFTPTVNTASTKRIHYQALGVNNPKYIRLLNRSSSSNYTNVRAGVLGRR